MNRSKNKIVTGYAKMWPREVLEAVSYVELANDPHLDQLHKPGVYILYRDDQAFYIGKAKGTLLGRLHFHATKSTGKKFLFWNFFSFFVVPEAEHVDELEGILIASVGTTTNSAEPKIKRIQIPKALRSKLRDISRRKFRTGEE